jgi:SpoVK/Ycf46/Vps4 family AAA+-type ATPase
MVAMMQALRASIGDPLFMDDSASDDETRAEPKSADRRRLEMVEREARGKVEKWILTTELNVAWDEFVGNEEAHSALIEAIEFPVKHSELYAFYAKKPTKGIVLHGAPGCGKTMFGKAAATAIAKMHGLKTATLLSVKANELDSKYYGESEQRIRDIFAYAKAYKNLHGHQLVIFMDEADAMLPSRDGNVTVFHKSNVAAFLAEMDGLEEPGALVILATNRPEALDAALLRDGRCDRKIVVKRPSQDAARVIFEKNFASAPTVVDKAALVDYAIDEFFSPFRRLYRLRTEKGTDYMRMFDVVNGAMIVGLVERAKASAFHRDVQAGARSGITREYIFAAIDQVMKENMGQRDTYALREYAERVGVDAIAIEALQSDIKIDVAASATLN